MARGLVTLVVALILPACCGVASAGPSKDLVGETVEEFNREMREVRAGHPLLPVNYLEQGDQVYGYSLPRQFVRLAKAGDKFRIRKFKTKDTYVRLELETTRKTKLKVFIFDNDELSQVFLDEVVPAVLSGLFNFGEPPSESPFVAHAGSKLVHHGSCNHPPPPGKRKTYATLQSALDAGCEKCGVCFSDEIILPIEGFSQARAAAIEATRRFEISFPPVDDPEVQGEVQWLGENIVKDFPVETIGFDYTFKVVHSTIPQAYSFRTGFVYVTDRLLSVIEDPAELSFVLAHEIAHCELTLPPRGQDAPELENGYALTREQLSKWWQHRETVADLLAVNYIHMHPGDGDAMYAAKNILRKIQFGLGELPNQEAEWHGTHPLCAERLNLLEPSRFQPGGIDQVFCGLDDNGETLVLMRVLGLYRDNEDTMIYILVEGTDLVRGSETPWATVGASQRVGVLEDTYGESSWLYKTDFSLTIAPGSVAMAALKVGWRSRFEELDVSAPQKLELDRIDDVDRWTRCPPEDLN